MRHWSTAELIGAADALMTSDATDAAVRFGIILDELTRRGVAYRYDR